VPPGCLYDDVRNVLVVRTHGRLSIHDLLEMMQQRGGPIPDRLILDVRFSQLTTRSTAKIQSAALTDVDVAVVVREGVQHGVARHWADQVPVRRLEIFHDCDQSVTWLEELEPLV
jgi:hypothetical protein